MSISEEPEDPDNILWYWHKTVFKSSAENTVDSNRRIIRRFERFLAAEGGWDYEGSWTEIEPDDVPLEDMIRPRNVNEDTAYKYLNEYLKEDYEGGTQHNTAGALSRAYTWCIQKTKPVDADPIGYVLDNYPNLLDDPEEREPYMIDIEEARRIMSSWTHPLYLAPNLTLAKTARRVGAVVNLDVRDVNIDHPACDWTVRQEIRHWPDHIAFTKDKAKSETGRKAGNKTETTRKVPIDDELKDTLLLYLAIRRGSLEPYEPFFRGERSDRLHRGTLGDHLREKAKEMGHWYGPNDDDNIGPHYWRHWTTSWFEDRLGEHNTLTEYIRGDKGTETKSRYNHWTEKKEEIYLEHVPKFFTGDQQQ